ncbi:MAG: VWA domain-containing protein [Acidobacteriaceae bacterium]|nr:VWA domain-containing protein [Acidobacteriaceae bacterium]
MHSETVVDLCRFLRDQGFQTSVLETLTSTEVARALAFADITTLQYGLRAAICSSREEWDAFNALFDSFFAGDRKPEQNRDKQISAAFLTLGGRGASSDGENEGDARQTSGASFHDRMTRTDLSALKSEDKAALERIAQRIFRQAAARLSRRLKQAGRPAALDLRRMIYHSVPRGGEIIDLSYKRKRPKKPALVILLDVSGSMNAYSFFLLRFAHALQKQFRGSRTFAFSTRLVDITAELRPPHFDDSLKRLSAAAISWSGGTRIGESVATFNALYGRKLLSRDTFFIILSDGWDTGEPERLASELRAIREKVRKLIWLNPLLGLEEYRPATRAMAAALPYLDVFAPAHSLESLARLEQHLCSMSF